MVQLIFFESSFISLRHRFHASRILHESAKEKIISHVVYTRTHVCTPVYLYIYLRMYVRMYIYFMDIELEYIYFFTFVNTFSGSLHSTDFKIA